MVKGFAGALGIIRGKTPGRRFCNVFKFRDGRISRLHIYLDPDYTGEKNRGSANMSNSISALLTRNLQEVFGENDPARRRAAVQELYTEDGVFYDPSKGVYGGRDAIDRIAGEIRATHLDFRYQPIAEPEETGNGGRVRWVAGRPGEAPAYAGTDFIIARDGRIAALYLFFDKLP
jgi:ketosteroid isomerase-like protein